MADFYRPDLRVVQISSAHILLAKSQSHGHSIARELGKYSPCLGIHLLATTLHYEREHLDFR